MRWAALLMLLAGCDTMPKRVEIPVPVACVDTVPAPATVYTDAELAAMNDGQFTDAIWLDRTTLLRKNGELAGIVRRCSVVR